MLYGASACAWYIIMKETIFACKYKASLKSTQYCNDQKKWQKPPTHCVLQELPEVQEMN